MNNKVRLDELLVIKKFFNSKEEAKTKIMSGKIIVDNKKIFKPGTLIKENSKVIICGKKKYYVGRGALKLKDGLKYFKIDILNKRCMDIGASTGGFTEILLLNEAKIIYSVDVGYNQLSWKLRESNKIIVLEKTNARYLTLDKVGNILFDFISIDVSFISLTKILDSAYNCLKKNGEAIVLVKPQFEANRKEVNKKGVVEDKEIHINVLKKIKLYAENLGFSVIGIINSLIKGKQGNIEYFFYFKKEENKKNISDLEIYKIVEKVFNI